MEVNFLGILYLTLLAPLMLVVLIIVVLVNVFLHWMRGNVEVSNGPVVPAQLVCFWSEANKKSLFRSHWFDVDWEIPDVDLIRPYINEYREGWYSCRRYEKSIPVVLARIEGELCLIFARPGYFAGKLKSENIGDVIEIRYNPNEHWFVLASDWRYKPNAGW